MPQSPHPLGEIAWDFKDAIDQTEAEMLSDDGVIDSKERQVLAFLRAAWTNLTGYHGRQVAAASFERNGLTRHVRDQFRAVGIITSTTTIETETILAITAGD